MNKHLTKILDCMSGVDGGISFLKLKVLVDNLGERADNGDEDAAKILMIVEQFSRLIDAAQ